MFHLGAMTKLTLPATPLAQRGATIYIAVIKAGDLVDNYLVDRWHRTSNPDGYQRKEYQDKMEEYKNYLLNPDLTLESLNLIDQTILANVRGHVQFSEGKIRIEGELFVVDGQHRAGGLKLACEADPTLREIEVPIVLSSESRDAERARFFVINEKTKRVATDLAEQQLTRVNPEIAKLVKSKFEPELVKWGLDVVSKLNSSSAIWSGKITVKGAED